MEYWCVYLIECSDKTLYCGSTNDLKKRISAHNKGKAAKYTRGRIPVKLIAYKDNLSKSAALKLEYKIKHIDKKKKVDFLGT